MTSSFYTFAQFDSLLSAISLSIKSERIASELLIIQLGVISISTHLIKAEWIIGGRGRRYG